MSELEELKLGWFLGVDLDRAEGMGLSEVRFLIDTYYTMQDWRKASVMQIRDLGEAGEPHDLLLAFKDRVRGLEVQAEKAMQRWVTPHKPRPQDPIWRVNQWAISVTGIGHVIAAGLSAHIDIEKAVTVGHIWRFAGLDPTSNWEPKTKRPWNATLKTLCWKIGESIVHNQNRAGGDFYGQLYLYRKEQEQRFNEEGCFAAQARGVLEKTPKHAQATIYRTGKLPPSHIQSRAKRYVVKLFLAHWHHVAFEARFGTPPPAPYVITHLGHIDHLVPPNWPMPAAR